MAPRPKQRGGNSQKNSKLKDQVGPKAVNPGRRFLIPTSAIDTVATYVTLAFGASAGIAQQFGHLTVALWMLVLTVFLAAIALIAHAYEKRWWPWLVRGQDAKELSVRDYPLQFPVEVRVESPATDDIQRAAHYLSDPTPDYIAKTIEDAAPLARQHAMAQFLGSPVAWDGRLILSSAFLEKTTVMLGYGLKRRNYELYFGFEASFPKHNFLQQMKEGTPLHVDGIISHVDSGHILLKDVFVRVVEADDTTSQA